MNTMNPGDKVRRVNDDAGLLQVSNRVYTVKKFRAEKCASLPSYYGAVELEGVLGEYDAHRFVVVERAATIGGVTTAPKQVTLEELTAPSSTHPSLTINKPLYDGHLLPEDSAERKTIPLFSVLFGYFPSAMVALANHSYKSNEKHNPGEELHWSRGKSDDHQDAALRHLAEGDYLGLLWRAAALLQLELESKGAPKAPKAR